MRLWLLLTLTFTLALSLVLFGGALAWKQHRLLRDAGPTIALVRQARLDQAPPRVVFDYTLGNSTYRRDGLTPLPLLTAASLPALDANRPGETVTVYVARNGRDAFLLPLAQAYPHLLLWLGLALGVGGVAAVRRSGVADPPPAPMPLPHSDWCALAVTRTPTQAVTGRVIEALAWLCVTAAPALLYTVTVTGTTTRGFDPLLLLVVVTVLPAAFALARAWRWSRLVGRLAHVEVTTMKAVVELDQPVIAHVQIAVNEPLPLAEARLALVCRRRRGLTATKLYFNSSLVTEHRTVPPLAPCSQQCTFEVPRSKRRDGAACDRFSLPRYEWCFELHLRPTAGGRYVMRFPVAAVTSESAKAKAPAPTLRLATAAA